MRRLRNSDSSSIITKTFPWKSIRSSASAELEEKKREDSAEEDVEAEGRMRQVTKGEVWKREENKRGGAPGDHAAG